MTKKEIVKAISDVMHESDSSITQVKVKEIVQRTFDLITDTLVENGRIELRNFGVFEVKTRAARRARNPRTGERVDVAEKSVVTFKPGKEMEERVGLLDEAREAAAAGVVPPSPESASEPPHAATPAETVDAPAPNEPPVAASAEPQAAPESTFDDRPAAAEDTADSGAGDATRTRPVFNSTRPFESSFAGTSHD